MLPPAQVEQFFDGLVPSETQLLLEAGDEESLRKAVELDPKNVDAAFALAQLLYRRGDSEGALELVAKAPGNFRADGLAARIELERSPSPEIEQAFATLDDGELEDGLDELVALLAAKNNNSERIRRVIVAILDELGVEHPLRARPAARWPPRCTERRSAGAPPLRPRRRGVLARSGARRARAAPRRTGARRRRVAPAARPGCRPRDELAVARRQHLVLGAVHDERRRGDLAQPRARVVRDDRLHLGDDHCSGTGYSAATSVKRAKLPASPAKARRR